MATILRRRGVPDDAATEALDRLERVGLIDDVAFAESWVQSRHAGKGLSASALARELQRKGIEPSIVAAAVAVIDAESERTAAEAIARQRAGRLAGLPKDVALRRLSGLLARKGYGPGLAHAVARDVLGAEVAALD